MLTAILVPELFFMAMAQDGGSRETPAALSPKNAAVRLGTPEFRHGDFINSVCFSTDGKFIVSGSDDKTLRVWDATTGREIHRLPHKSSVEAGLFLSDNQWLASA